MNTSNSYKFIQSGSRGYISPGSLHSYLVVAYAAVVFRYKSPICNSNPAVIAPAPVIT